MRRYASRDTDRYLENYPGQKDNPEAKDNLLFYSNQIESRPRGALVEDMHRDWFGNYDLLEMHHGFIQWIFPIRERGVNYQAQVLQLHEANAIKADETMRGRVLNSYRMMLDFYGMVLVDPTTGEICRSATYRGRYRNLNVSWHNYPRITRILKSLGELGWDHLQAPLCRHLVDESFGTGALSAMKRSLEDYFLQVVRDGKQREVLEARIKKLKKGKGSFDEKAFLEKQEALLEMAAEGDEKVKAALEQKEDGYDEAEDDEDRKAEERQRRFISYLPSDDDDDAYEWSDGDDAILAEFNKRKAADAELEEQPHASSDDTGRDPNKEDGGIKKSANK